MVSIMTNLPLAYKLFITFESFFLLKKTPKTIRNMMKHAAELIFATSNLHGLWQLDFMCTSGPNKVVFPFFPF